MGHFYEVVGAKYQRSNKDGSVTTFVKGETVETDGPVDDDRLKALGDGPGPFKAPAPAGFLHENRTYDNPSGPSVGPAVPDSRTPRGAQTVVNRTPGRTGGGPAMAAPDRARASSGVPQKATTKSVGKKK